MNINSPAYFTNVYGIDDEVYKYCQTLHVFFREKEYSDTLFVSPENFKTEVELKFPFNRIYKEHLRLGTIDLMNWIQEQGIELWVYTTSFRSERYIRALFRCYGIKLDAVVNGERHAREVQADKKEAMPSKYPGKYRIDLHIDDDISVVQNGRVYGFKVFLIGSPIFWKKTENDGRNHSGGSFD